MLMGAWRARKLRVVIVMVASAATSNADTLHKAHERHASTSGVRTRPRKLGSTFPDESHVLMAWRHAVSVLGWVRWPQQTLVKAAGERAFAIWYVRTNLEWRRQHWQPAILVSRVLWRESFSRRQVALRPLTRLEEVLVICDGVVAITLVTLAASADESEHSWARDAKAKGLPAGSLAAFGYLFVWLFESIEAERRPWRRAANVCSLFGNTAREQRLAKHARHLAARQLRIDENRFAFDVPSMLALGWRLALGASCLSCRRAARPAEPATGATSWVQHRLQHGWRATWLTVAMLVKWGVNS